jgi:hypothetical protein
MAAATPESFTKTSGADPGVRIAERTGTGHWRRPRLPRFGWRSMELVRLLDAFLIFAVLAVLGNRVFLEITGYPKVQTGKLHIAHVLWGGLMMMIAIVFATAFVAPATRRVVAVLGGIGFGFFIDELGKFITTKTDYLFKPTIAIIYTMVVALYVIFRALARRRWSADEAVLNALETLKAAAIGQLDEPRRRAALGLLHDTGAGGAIARIAGASLADATALPPQQPTWSARAGHRLRQWYLAARESPRFVPTITAVFFALAASYVIEGVALGVGETRATNFTEQVCAISSLVAGGFLVRGVLTLPHSRAGAYRWFDRGLLIEIFVTQVFAFNQSQLLGVCGLAVMLTMWALLQSGMRAEDAERSVGRPSWEAAT